GIADHGIRDPVTLGLLDVLRPPRVIGDRIDAETNDLAAPLVELGLQAGHVAELGRADRGEILRMGEEDGPSRADPLVEVDGPLGGLRSEVWSLAVDPQRHDDLLLCPRNVRDADRMRTTLSLATSMSRGGTPPDLESRPMHNSAAAAPWKRE